MAGDINNPVPGLYFHKRKDTLAELKADATFLNGMIAIVGTAPDLSLYAKKDDEIVAITGGDLFSTGKGWPVDGSEKIPEFLCPVGIGDVFESDHELDSDNGSDSLIQHKIARIANLVTTSRRSNEQPADIYNIFAGYLFNCYRKKLELFRLLDEDTERSFMRTCVYQDPVDLHIYVGGAVYIENVSSPAEPTTGPMVLRYEKTQNGWDSTPKYISVTTGSDYPEQRYVSGIQRIDSDTVGVVVETTRALSTSAEISQYYVGDFDALTLTTPGITEADTTAAGGAFLEPRPGVKCILRNGGIGASPFYSQQDLSISVTDDNGATWHKFVRITGDNSSNLIQREDVSLGQKNAYKNIAIDGSGSMYVPTENGKIWKVTVATPISDPPTVTNPGFSAAGSNRLIGTAHDGSNLFIASEDVVYKSTDGGASGTPITNAGDLSAKIMHIEAIAADDLVIVCANDAFCDASKSGRIEVIFSVYRITNSIPVLIAREAQDFDNYDVTTTKLCPGYQSSFTLTNDTLQLVGSFGDMEPMEGPMVATPQIKTLTV